MSSTAYMTSYFKMINENWIENDREGNDCDIISGTVSSFPGERGGGGGNHVRIVGIPIETQTGHLSNANQKVYRLKQLFRE
jgi:hypothetical protein